ncbi:hypothetical protein Pcac1_g11918 [Phytophthora cactorum]|uniref:Secreted protein n=1 Tax=Phytophthora cactorum TaxID=29920 RepID=A0A8T1EDX1_9STRA|nr:hypothetical protein Pcac1_g11918 [Phytophthora cactorum]KAG2953006.1 hypothetical protein PC117_g2344 [Phytophthora cactorum]KAG3037782.1 hypothetical protein PC119_g3368 [Phytophthora cactorum]KAG4050608.1 hypothetical protein PC123_g14153 [Phytophthora cactorum]
MFTLQLLTALRFTLPSTSADYGATAQRIPPATLTTTRVRVPTITVRLLLTSQAPTQRYVLALQLVQSTDMTITLPRIHGILPFERDDPAPLLDRAGSVRHIVQLILTHDDTLVVPPVSRTGRGAHHRDDAVPPHQRFLVR